MTDIKNTRPAVRHLVHLLKFRATYGRPCYIKRTTVDAALIVPSLTNGPEGPYEYLRTFRRTTVDEAAHLGFIRLGPQLTDMPSFGNGAHWSFEPAHKGRTITLTAGGAK